MYLGAPIKTGVRREGKSVSTDRPTSRRGLLIGAAGLAAIAWSWQRFGMKDVKLAFEPIPGLVGWEAAQTGGLTAIGGSATDAVFLGLDDPGIEPLPAEALCDALYETTGPGTPVAVFTDFFCPNCQIMDATLAARSDLALTWHELPLLGPNSERVARAMVASRQQNGGDALKRSLSKAPFRPSPRFFAAVAEDAGLDPQALLDAMESPSVDAALAKSRAAAEALGVWGTPAIAIGQRLILGRLASDQIDTLIADTPAGC